MIVHRRGLLLLAVAAAALVAVDRAWSEPVAHQDRAVEVRDEGGTASATALPAALRERCPPGTSVRYQRSFAPRDCESGIACPGGGFLPLLNGVPHAPPLQRNLDLLGPVPPVVGKYTDADGDEWHVHADGSQTTSRWTTLTIEGVARRDVRTDHTAPARPEHGVHPGEGSAGR